MLRFLSILFCGCAWLLVTVPAAAQILPGYDSTVSDTRVRIGENHVRLTGGVELERGDTKIYADEAEVFLTEDRAVATGNVVFTQGNNRISADRADFNIKTRLGTFYHAWGIATPQPPKRPVRPGAIAPPIVAGEDTDVYFFGETIEKIGPKKYKITNGGFSTCVQPTPRWELHADTVLLNVDHYTMLRQAIFSVKGVPMLYVPIMYYPTKKEERATGILIPTYGSSTLRGQQLHNAFFWAIDRSQDATFMHEWYSKVGQGLAGQYRYNFGGGSDGEFNAHFLNQHEAAYEQPNGSVTTVSGGRSYELRANANQILPGGIRARTHVNYFSNLQTNQTFNTNVFDASSNTRTYGGNIIGAWAGYSLNGTFDRTEYFYDARNSTLTGGAPRVAFSKSERPLFGSDLYYAFSGEYVHLLQDNRAETTTFDKSLTRLDFNPQIRFPFKKWQWFTVNSSLAWRDTYYTRSYDLTKTDPTTQQPVIVDTGLNRRFFTFQTQISGPVFNRIWDTPDNGYAEKFKHTIEPFLNVQRTTSIDNTQSIVQIESIDTIIGGVTQYTYGVNNRFYAKVRQEAGRPSMPREVASVELTQTYYTDERAAQFDQQYVTSFTTQAPNNFSPIALSVRAAPSINLNASMRAEFDSRYHALRTISFNTSYSWTNRLQTTVGWSKRGFIKQLPGFDNKNFLDQYINTSTTVHTTNNRFGGTYTFNYDVLNSRMLQQRMSGFYNAQCCGIAIEYQTYNFGGLNVPVPADHRFFMSFTLAGLGNFSPFNGALGGVPR